MPSSSRRLGAPLLVAALFLTLPLLWLVSRIPVPGFTRVELEDAGSGRSLLVCLLSDGEQATLAWTNSLFGLAVTEVFEARGGRLVQTRVAFADPAGGEPPRARPEDLDDLYHTGGPFRVEGLARPLDRVVYRVGEIGNPVFRAAGQCLALKPAVGFGGAVRLTARPGLLRDRLPRLASLRTGC